MLLVHECMMCEKISIEYHCLSSGCCMITLFFLLLQTQTHKSQVFVFVASLWLKTIRIPRLTCNDIPNDVIADIFKKAPFISLNYGKGTMYQRKMTC